MHSRKFTQKTLSVLCAVILVLTAVAVPAAVTAMAANAPATGSFSLDFSSADSKAPQFGVLETDAAGNPFTPIKAAVGTSKVSAFAPSTELVSLEDGDGITHDMLKITIPAMNSGNGAAVNIVLLDENGHPFVMAPNTTYSVNADIYVKTANANNLLTYGTGSIARVYSRASADTPNMNGSSRIDMNVKAWDESSSVKNPIPWNAKDNIASFGYSVDGNQYFMFDPMYQITASKFVTHNHENWYDKEIRIANKEFTTGGFTADRNVYWKDLTDSQLRYVGGFENYFVISFEKYKGELATEIYIDSLSVAELLPDVTLNANGGTVFGESVYGYPTAAGKKLPVPYKAGTSFAYWYLSEGDTEIPVDAVMTADLAGKTLYAKYVDSGVYQYTFDNNEIIRSLSDEVETFDDHRFITVDGIDYFVNADNFKYSAEQVEGKGVDGTRALWLGGSDNGTVKSGAWPINNGDEFFFLEPSTVYKVEMDVKADQFAEGSDTSIALCYGLPCVNPYYHAANGTFMGTRWSDNKLYAKATLARIVKRVYVEDADPETAGLPEEEKTERTDVFGYSHSGEIVPAPVGEWVHLEFRFTSPAEFPEANENYPLPTVLGISGTWQMGTDVAIDNVTVEASKVSLDAGDLGYLETPFNAFYGETAELPAPTPNSDNITFSHWEDEDGNRVTGEVTFGTEKRFFTAVYTATAGSVTFMDADGETVIAVRTGEMDDPVIFPDDPVLEGRCFAGWVDKDGNVVTEISITANQVVLTAFFGDKGDANMDGEVDMRDLVRLAKKVAGQNVKVSTVLGDVTGDGLVTNSDLIRLKKYFAGVGGIVLE